MLDQKSPISFIMPAFNCAGTIDESILSIINGNFLPADELIVVNDGSTDKTLDRIHHLQKEYPFIKLIENKKNLGCPASRNIGIRAAKSSLIFNLDADDILAKGSVDRLKHYLIKHHADIAAFGESRFFVNDTNKVTHMRLYKTGTLTLADYLAGPYVPGGNYLYTKKIWTKVGGYWEYGKGLHEFWGFTLKLLANGAKMIVLPKSYYFHRYGNNSLFIRETKKNKDESSLMATKMILNYIQLINKDDAAYIRSDQGSRTWFENLTSRPIRLKSGKVGVTGRKVILRRSSLAQIREFLSSLVLKND